MFFTTVMKASPASSGTNIATAGILVELHEQNNIIKFKRKRLGKISK